MNTDISAPHPKQLHVYIGTYTDAQSEGIYTCQLDLATGELKELTLAGRTPNPSYLAIDSGHQRLFAVNELSEFGGQPGGGVSAFAIDPVSGELTLINQVNSLGGAPCYIALDQTQQYVFVVNYSGGAAAVFPVQEEGGLGPASGFAQHQGSSRKHDRQDSPHPHSVVPDAANAYAFVPDLGLDRIMQYRFEHTSGRLLANDEPWAAARPGAGPRHMVFGPTGETAYVVGELDSTITAFAYNPARGTFQARQTVSMLPGEYSGPNLAADIHLTPDGRFLYGSNRGHDSIAAYAIDEDTGTLTPIQHIATQGRNPRGFAIDPTGTFLLVANQHTNEILTFWIDPRHGSLAPTGFSIEVPSPVCVKLMPLANI